MAAASRLVFCTEVALPRTAASLANGSHRDGAHKHAARSRSCQSFDACLLVPSSSSSQQAHPRNFAGKAAIDVLLRWPPSSSWLPLLPTWPAPLQQPLRRHEQLAGMGHASGHVAQVVVTSQWPPVCPAVGAACNASMSFFARVACGMSMSSSALTKPAARAADSVASAPSGVG